jgi:uncharacterized protein YjdB
MSVVELTAARQLPRVVLLAIAAGFLANCGGGCVGACEAPTAPVATVHSVTVTPTAASVTIGTTTTLAAAVTADAGVDQTVDWSSSASTIATVANGTVTGVSAGTATITARSRANATIAASAVVTVVGRVNSVTVTSATGSILVGGTTPATAVVSADTGVSTGVTWTTSNASVATVSSAGLVKGIGAGTATITATSTADLTKQGSSPITVCSSAVFTLGATLTGTISKSSCHSSGAALVDEYTYTSTATALVSFQLTSTTLPTWLVPLRLLTGVAAIADQSTTTATQTGYAFIKAGTYSMSAGSSDSTKTGSYSVTTAFNPPFPTGCTQFPTTGGFSFILNLLTTSCSYAPQGLTGTFYADEFVPELPVGTALTVTVFSSVFNPLIEIKDAGVVLATSAGQTGTTVTATFTISDTHKLPVVNVTSRTAGQSGGYTLTLAP